MNCGVNNVVRRLWWYELFFTKRLAKEAVNASLHTFTYRTSSPVCKSITRFSRPGVDRMCQLDVFDTAIDAPENPMKRYPHHYPLGRYNARGHSRTGRAHFPYTVTVIPTIQITGMKEKDMVRQKGPFFPHTVKGQNRCSTLVLAASDGVLRGFLPRIRPVLALVQHFGVLREPPLPQNRCLQRYGMKEEQKWPFFLHTGIPDCRESSGRLDTASDGHSRAICSTVPHNRTVVAGGSAIDALTQQSRVGESAALLRTTFFAIQV